MKAVRSVKGMFVRCAMLAALFLAGCTPSTEDVSRDDDPQLLAPSDVVANMPLEKNVKGVAASYDPHNPWIMSDDRSRIVGIVVSTLFLEGPKVLGVFGDGIIRPRLYVIDSVDGKPLPPRLAKEWSFNPEEAKRWRSRKRTAQGWGYRLHLFWEKELDLAGKEIRMTVSFERADGLVVHSGKKDFRVPAK